VVLLGSYRWPGSRMAKENITKVDCSNPGTRHGSHLEDRGAEFPGLHPRRRQRQRFLHQRLPARRSANSQEIAQHASIQPTTTVVIVGNVRAATGSRQEAGGSRPAHARQAAARSGHRRGSSTGQGWRRPSAHVPAPPRAACAGGQCVFGDRGGGIVTDVRIEA